MYKDNWQASAF